MIIHTADHFLRKRYRTYSLAEWTRLTCSLWLCLFALFTGFILKGDLEALFAGRIFMNLLKSLPLVGEPLSRGLMVPGERFFFLPYLYHCLFLPVLIGYLMKAHIREWLPNQRFLLGVTTGIFLYALLIKPHMAIPPEATMGQVTGPWFFLGIQTLLKTMPPVVAGFLLPGLFVGCVLMIGMVGGPSRRIGTPRGWPVSERILHLVVVISFCLYGFLTIRALFKGP
jgi:ubiquinol-cytochrome c reductase cytochrome b subunit